MTVRKIGGSESLRVLHLAHIRWFNAEVQYALDLAGAMRDRGHRPTVLTQTGSPGTAAVLAAGLDSIEENGFNAGGLSSLSACSAALRLLRLLTRERFDAVEVHRPEGLPLIAWACRRANVPAVRVRGDMRPVRSDPLNRALYGRVLAAVVASNSAIAADLRRRLGPTPKVVMIPGGVDPDEFSDTGERLDVRAEFGFPADSLLVGILGRLGPIKGHDAFLEGARLALERGARAAFVILAKEPNPREAQLRRRVADDPLLRGRVAFLGNRGDLPAVLRGFDLGVVASTGSEANCRVGLEWMASGVPLVASRIGVLPDLIDEGDSGYLVAPGSASALAEKIVYLAGRPDEAHRLGEASRRKVLAQFTLGHCAAAHELLIRDILVSRSHVDL